MNQIFKRLRIAILIFIVLITIFIFFGIYRPITIELEKEVLNNYELVTHNKYLVFKEFVKEARDNAASLSSRTGIRDMLSDYLDGKVTFEELIDYSSPRYNDGASVIENLKSTARITTDGQVIHIIGSDANYTESIDLDIMELVSIYNPDEKLYPYNLQ